MFAVNLVVTAVPNEQIYTPSGRSPYRLYAGKPVLYLGLPTRSPTHVDAVSTTDAEEDGGKAGQGVGHDMDGELVYRVIL